MVFLRLAGAPKGTSLSSWPRVFWGDALGSNERGGAVLEAT